MLKFLIYKQDKPVKQFPLDGAYLAGTDHVPIRAELELRAGELLCHKRAQGPASLAVLWPVQGAGRILLETTRLPERDRPYSLHLELARGQMMRLAQKREDWGLFDIENIEQITRSLKRGQDLLIESIKTGDVAAAARLADEALQVAVPLGEQMALFHAGVFLNRRRQTGSFSRRLFGCGINLRICDEIYRRRLINGLDFACVPISWREIEPKQGEYAWDALDEWVDWLTQHRIPIKAAPLVSLDEQHIPDWLYIYEHDFEAVRDFMYEHIRRVVRRYMDRVSTWDSVSGIHAVNTFNLNFEQIMDVTRMSAAITKQISPQATVVVDLVAPWGEYYARNTRTIPPMLYADMLIQNGIHFDALGVQFYVGVNRDGMYVRDMLQFSSMLDRFANFGKPLHITAVQVPSKHTVDQGDAWNGAHSPADGGNWYDDWSEPLQSRWLREFYNIALSKPIVETIAWRDLSDSDAHYLPHGGLLRADLSPKLAYEQLCTIRAQIHGAGIPRAGG